MKRCIDILLILIMAGATLFTGYIVIGARGALSPDETIAKEPEPIHIRLAFAGDLMQHIPQVNAARNGDGFDYSRTFEYVRHYFESADVAFINLETTLTTTDNYTGYPCFRSPSALSDAVANAGIDITLLANNHCCDGGGTGIRTTVAELDRSGVKHTGVFTDSIDYKLNNPLHVECGGVRMAVLNYTYSTNGIPVPKGCIVNFTDTVVMASDLARVDRDRVDCIIAVMHWGNEYERHENRIQRYQADFLRRHGVDIIIGGHPHVIQPVEADSTMVTVYSLGNFVSNQQKRYTDGGLIALVDIEKCDGCKPSYSLSVIPVWVLCPGYRIITPEAGDTMKMADWARVRYDQFMSDTKELLAL